MSKRTELFTAVKIEYWLACLTIFSFAFSLPANAENCTGAPVSGNYYSLVNQGSGKALDISQESRRLGGNAIQWTYKASGNQQFYLTDLGNGYWSIQAFHSGLVLDVAGGSVQDGANILQWSYHGGNNQQWQLKQNASGAFDVISRQSNKSMTVANGDDGSNIYQQTDNGSSYQRWYFNPVDGNCSTDNGTVNRPPKASIDSTSESMSGQTVMLDGRGSSDPDGDTLAFSWRQIQGKQVALTDNSGSTLSFISPIVDQPETLAFQLTVDDGSLTDMTSVQILVSPAANPGGTGIHVSGSQVFESNGHAFIMRGINVPHAWYADKTASSLSDIAKTGANTVRMVLASGDRWNKTSESTVRDLIAQAKANHLIAILEVHDTTGYGEQSGAITLNQAVDYWKSIKGALIGQEDYVIIDIGNEPFGNGQPASAWIDGHVNAIKGLRSAGFKHALMVDAANWGQDWQNIMRDNAASVLAADPLKNVIFSVHMYQVYGNAGTISRYMSAFLQKKLALVVGEFAADHQGEDVDEASIMSYAQQYGYGYLGWSWSGNSAGLESLDIARNFNASTLSSWGETLINGPNGIKATASIATIFDR
jgi:mannan endo-1,4-beta-mannosidase